MIEELTRLGLSKKEAEIYHLLVKEAEADANKLAKLSHSNRTVTYNILQNLLRKGLISFITRKSKRFYQASSPENLLTSIVEKQKLAKDVISRLNKLKPNKTQENSVEVLEGIEGLKTIQREMLNARDLRILNATGLIRDVAKYSLPLLKEFSKRKIKILANKDYHFPEISNPKKVEVRYLSKSETNYATTFIFDNTIIIQVIKDQIFIVKIKNKLLYEGYKDNFDELWGIAKK